MDTFCAVCRVQLNSIDQYQAHITGGKHQLRVQKALDEAAAEGKRVAGIPLKTFQLLHYCSNVTVIPSIESICTASIARWKFNIAFLGG